MEYENFPIRFLGIRYSSNRHRHQADLGGPPRWGVFVLPASNCTNRPKSVHKMTLWLLKKNGLGPKRLSRCYIGADARIRTVDLLITNQLLYQLSYAGLGLRILAG